MNVRWVDKRELGKSIVRLIIAVAAICVFFVVTQDVHVFPEVLFSLCRFNNGELSQAAEGAGIESSFVRTTDGKDIEVWHLPAQKSAFSPPRAVIFFHGNGENLGNSVQVLQWLRSLGYSSFAFDYRGFGRSSGWPSEPGLERDARAVWEYAQKKTGLAAQQFLILGASIGTGIASHLASEIHPGALILLSPYKSLTEVVKEIPGLGFLHRFLWYRLPTEEYLEKMGSTCVVLAHGKRDHTIPYHHSADMFGKLKGRINISFIPSERAGHNDLLGHVSRRVAQAMLDCFTKGGMPPS